MYYNIVHDLTAAVPVGAAVFLFITREKNMLELLKDGLNLLLSVIIALCSVIFQGEEWNIPELLPAAPTYSESLSLESVPAYAGTPYVVLAGNQPDFSEEELLQLGEEVYSPMDQLGRCGPAFAVIGPETMPVEERGPIGQVKPSGWHLVKYDCVDGKYLYNRCHLIGYQLSGENANRENLITGTRYLNVQGMLPFENEVADYVEETGNHVAYRVTPVFQEKELLARGVQMEAWSVEDQGAGVCFNLYVYNVQPGVEIDYATGESWLVGEKEEEKEDRWELPELPGWIPDLTPAEPDTSREESVEEKSDYVLNIKTGRFHMPGCSGAESMSPSNRKDLTGVRADLLSMGYVPCGQCKP